jgi:two-component system phosphate regulon sensor histidine kinase PhoR
MRRRRLLWQIFPSFLLITLLSLLAVTWYSSKSLRDFYYRRREADLEARARLVQKQFSQRSVLADENKVDELCKELGRESSTRITVILPSGRVIGDTEKDPGDMENHGDRPEIRAALSGRVGTWTRPSPTLQTDMKYVALPLADKGEIIGVVRTSFALAAIDEALKAIRVKIVFGGLAIAGLAAIISWAIARGISRPLEEMQRGADRFARGELTRKLPVPSSREIGGLAEAMNQMAAELDEKIRTTLQQRNEREAILASMVEGVLAVDRDEHVITVNQAAAELLGIKPAEASGRSIQEVVRNADLQQLVGRALSSEKPVEAEITLRGDGERFLQAHGTVLRDGEGREIGALVVLNDMTRLRRLESVRREFVANVSHEIRTPITSIKGFVETLLDGAMWNPADAERFLGIVSKQVDRLNAIVTDLLTLSRIEQEPEKSVIPLEEAPIKEVLEAAIQVCELNATAKHVSIEVTCEENLSGMINSPLLEQAVVNLIDNAIKYSQSGGIVQVEGAETESEVTITVRDQGCGIAKQHLPRLFERFYRVDKARSRELGGTGLGLAIVKHIALAHGGHVSVESTLGKGSTFAIHLPKA